MQLQKLVGFDDHVVVVRNQAQVVQRLHVDEVEGEHEVKQEDQAVDERGDALKSVVPEIQMQSFSSVVKVVHVRIVLDVHHRVDRGEDEHDETERCDANLPLPDQSSLPQNLEHSSRRNDCESKVAEPENHLMRRRLFRFPREESNDMNDATEET